MKSMIGVVVWLSAVVWAQQPSAKPAPANFVLDADVNEWAGVAPTFTLQHPAPGGRDGVIWVAQNQRGIIVAGKVNGGTAHFAPNADAVLASDHVEIWVAIVKAPQMPGIGWGNQFGSQVIATEADCSKKGEAPGVTEPALCAKWFRAQGPWREKLRRLFAYQYVLGPGLVSEEFANPAYRAMAATTDDYNTVPNLTQPEHTTLTAAKPPAPSLPLQAMFHGTSDGYAFEALLPWESLPPAASLDLSNLLIMVDVFNAATPGRKTGAYSSTSLARKWGDASTFSEVRLDPPRHFQIGECGHPPVTTDIYGEKKYPLYFRPMSGDAISDTFFVRNTARGYQYDPAGMSPVVDAVSWFGTKLSPDEAVCGPQLGYKKGDKVIWAEFELDKGFETKRLSDGTLLINDQPRVEYSYFGSGQCGACARPGITIYRVLPGADKIDTALAWGDVVGNEVTDADIHVAPDWSKVTVFEQVTDYDKPDSEPVWRSETFCLQGNTYNSCEKKEHVAEPTPRVLKGLGEDQ